MEITKKKPFTFEQLEFWAATIVYVVSVYILVYNKFIQLNIEDLYAPNRHFYIQRNLHFSYTAFYFVPQLCINTIYYLGFLVLGCLVRWSVKSPVMIVVNILLALIVYALVASGISAADTWKMSYLFKDY